jgi:asparagine synthase (glutamine-hydrolysing)
MTDNEKVVLTGEGADELLFGYDRIFSWGNEKKFINPIDFLERYAYSGSVKDLPPDALDYIADMMRDKSPIEFLEDFFIEVHLPGLLRRMDGASMCASKEARVPFVTTSLFNLFYRQKISARYINGSPKGPLRLIAQELNLMGALNRKKVGFSANIQNANPQSEYQYFQQFCLNELKWS